MRDTILFAALLAAVTFTGGCDRQAPPSAVQTPDPLPARPADPEADDPKTGTNTGRPDSIEDLKAKPASPTTQTPH